MENAIKRSTSLTYKSFSGDDANVDPGQAAYYRELSDKWWDTEGAFWPLHGLNNIRTRYLSRLLREHFDRPDYTTQPLQGLSVLDIGCGGGLLSEAMAHLGARVHGIDVVNRNIETARYHALQQALDIRYEYGDVDLVMGRGEQYDVVLNMEVVEHVPAPHRFLRDGASLVKPGGVMAVATINRTLLAWLFAIVGAEYVLNLLPKGTHEYDKLIKPSELARWARAAGLNVEAMIGLSYNPITKHYRLVEGDVSVNYMIRASKPA